MFRIFIENEIVENTTYNIIRIKKIFILYAKSENKNFFFMINIVYSGFKVY